MNLDVPDTVVPLSLTADTDGILYFAGYNGSAVYKVDPR